jgi:glycosyltransferase involved in cell wall biosynthesis
MPEVAGEAALLVNPRSVEDLAQALGRVLADETLRRELEEKGLHQASQFSWEQTARLTLQAYEDAWFSFKRGKGGC